MRGWIHGIAKADEGTPAEKIIFDIKLNRKWQKRTFIKYKNVQKITASQYIALGSGEILRFIRKKVLNHTGQVPM